MEYMKSFILHVYPRNITPESPLDTHEIVGVVESIEDEKQTPFTSPQELWKILAKILIRKKRIIVYTHKTSF